VSEVSTTSLTLQPHIEDEMRNPRGLEPDLKIYRRFACPYCQHLIVLYSSRWELDHTEYHCSRCHFTSAFVENILIPYPVFHAMAHLGAHGLAIPNGDIDL